MKSIYYVHAIILVAVIVALITPAHAVCSNNEDGDPGQAGEVEYFTAANALRYCDDTNWIDMVEPCGGGATACGGNPDERVVFLGVGGAKDQRAGGLLGLDAQCTHEAYNINGISGVFYAWAADTISTNAPAGRFEHPTVPYKLVDGTTIASNWSDLIDGTISAAIDMLADGTTQSCGVCDAATNVNTDGTIYSTNPTDSCNGWTQFTGAPHRGYVKGTNSTWTNRYTSGACNNGMWAYCVEQQGSNKVGILKHADNSVTPDLEDIRELAVWGNHAFLLSNANKSLTSIDFSDPVNSLPVDDTYVDSTNLSVPRGIAVDGNFAYIVSTASDSLVIVDISNPTNLVAPTGGNGGVLVDGTNLNGAYGVDIQGDYAYVVGQAMNQMTIVDVSDRASPAIVSGGTVSITGASKVFVSGSYAYVVSPSTDTLSIVDVSTPSSPSVSGSLTDATNLDGATQVRVQGSYAYVTASNYNALVVVDISNKSSPAIANIGNAKVVEDFYLGGASGLVVDGSFAYVTSSAANKSGLSIIDISDPLNPFISARSRSDDSFFSGPLTVGKSGNFLIAASPGRNRVMSYEALLNHVLGDACTVAGDYYYDSASKKMVWCNGTNLVPMDFSGGGTGGCSSPSANEGAMDYDHTADVMRFCDGDGWIDIGK